MPGYWRRRHGLSILTAGYCPRLAGLAEGSCCSIWCLRVLRSVQVLLRWLPVLSHVHRNIHLDRFPKLGTDCHFNFTGNKSDLR
jgi:hypothetical protein